MTLAGAVKYCRTGKQAKDEVIKASVSIYEQCVDFEEPEALIVRIRPSDQKGGSGVNVGDDAEFTPIDTAESVKARGQLYAGREISYKVSVQAGSFDKLYDELDYGLKFEDADDRDGWVTMLKGDQVGVRKKRYSVMIYYSSGGELIGTDWCPDCEIMITGRGAMAAGQIYSHELDIKPQVFDDAENRVRCDRKKDSANAGF